MYTLFFSPGACSLAPHIILEEIGVPFRLDLRSARNGGEGTGTPDYLALNPKGRVPALTGVPGRMGGADGLLTEASAILLFLAKVHPETRLLPAEPAGEARCVEWLNWLSDTVHGMSLAQLWRPARFVSDPALHPAVVARGRENLLEHYAFIEGVLADGRDWAVPGGYGVVDPFLLVFWRWGHVAGLDMAAYPAWGRLTARVLRRAAVRRALAREGIDTDSAFGPLLAKASDVTADHAA